MEGITLRINVIETGGDWVLLCNSPFGRCSTTVPKPFTETQLLTALHNLEKANLKSTAKVLVRDAAPPEMTARAFGRQLVDVLFAGESTILFDRCRESARSRGVPMRLLVEANGPNASRIPWEFATDPNTRDDYLALRVPVARALSIAEPIPPLTVQPPLRVLGVRARPRDLPDLDYRREQERISSAFDSSSDLVEVHWLAGDRWRDIDDALRRGSWHVLHFVGHGGFSDEMGAGYLELSGEDGNAQRVSSVDIGRAISRSRDLRLVVLNACDSASSGGSDVFASTAAKLMREGVPAVVAMQYEITDDGALAFSAAFYEAIAHSTPVDEAVTFAREQVRINLGSLEWATPVLFLASDETSIFDVRVEPSASAPQGPSRPRSGPGGESPPDLPSPADPTADRSANGPAVVPAQSPASTAAHEWPAEVASTIRTVISKGKAARQGLVPRDDTATSPAPRPAEPGASERRTAPPRPAEPGASERRTALAVGPEGLVAVATEGGSVRAWSLEEHRWLARCSLPRGVTARRLAWHPGGRYVASANDDRTVTVWDLRTETHVRLLSPDCGDLRGAAFSHSGRWLVLTGSDRRVQVYDVHGKRVRDVRVEPTDGLPRGWGREQRPLGPVVFTSDDRGIVVAANDGRVCLMDVRGAVVSCWPHDAPVAALAVRQDRLATWAEDNRLRVWDSTHNLLWRHDVDLASHLSWSDDGRLVVASRTGDLTLWSADGRALARAAIEGVPAGVGFWKGAVVTGAVAGQIQVWRPKEEE